MGDSALLYWGMFCFSLTVVGMALTVCEFKKMSRSLETSIRAGTGRIAISAPLQREVFAGVIPDAATHRVKLPEQITHSSGRFDQIIGIGNLGDRRRQVCPLTFDVWVRGLAHRPHLVRTPYWFGLARAGWVSISITLAVLHDYPTRYERRRWLK